MSRRADGYRTKDQVECGLRVVAGEHDGLSAKWSHGVATVRPGGLTFRGTVGGVRFLRKAPVEVDVIKVDRSQQRTPSGKEIIAVSPRARVFLLLSHSGTLECAVADTEVAWLVDRLALS